MLIYVIKDQFIVDAVQAVGPDWDTTGRFFVNPDYPLNLPTIPVFISGYTSDSWLSKAAILAHVARFEPIEHLSFFPLKKEEYDALLELLRRKARPAT